MRVFPLSNWTELDVWRYIEREELELPSIYFAHEREVFERDGMLLAVRAPSSRWTASRSFTETGALPHRRRHDVHRRGALDGGHARDGHRRDRRDATSPSAAQTRADDRVSEAAMEDRKREGYF